MDIVINQALIVLILLFTRFTATILLIPLFGARNLPVRLKILFSLTMTFVFFVAGSYDAALSIERFDGLAMAVVFETLNGLTLGFVVMLIMNALYIAGFLIDMGMGFSMANVVSPTSEAQVPVTANLFYIIAMILFVVSNAHHAVISAFARTLQVAPLGSLALNPLHVENFFELIKETFVIGVQMALPMITVILIANIILGLLSKAMPGMNVFIVGMPFKILIGIAVLLMIMPLMVASISSLINRIFDYIARIIQLM